MATSLNFDIVAKDKASRVFDQVGKKSGLLGRSLGAVGSIAKVGLGGATIAAAGLGAVLTKGFSRLSNIEDATSKLQGLGHSAREVQTIMAGALAAVKGTAFGLDEAAGVAASAVAAGIKPGKQLNGVLRTIADTATIAQSSFSEAGAIIDKVAASNVLSLEEVNQLSDRGVPILAALAKQYGVNQGAIRKMVTQGKVDFKDFTKALDSTLGGAAKKSGDTTRGAFANLGAAVSRLGASLLSGVFPVIKQVFGGLTKFADQATAALAPLSEAFSKKLAAGLQKLAPQVKDALAGVQSAITQFISGFSGSLSGTNGPLSGAAALGQQAREIFDTLEPVLKRFGQTQITLAKAILSGLKPAFDAIVPVIAKFKPLFVTISETVAGLAPSIATIGAQLGVFVAGIVNLVAPAFDVLVAAMSKVVVIGAGIVKFLADHTTLLGLLASAILGAVTAYAALEVVSGVIKTITALTKLWAAAQFILNVVLTANPIGLIIVALGALAGALIFAWKNSETFRNVVLKAFGAIRQLAGWVTQLWTKVKTAFTQGKAKVTATVITFSGSIVGWFKSLPGKISRGLSSLGSSISGVFTRAFGAANKAVSTRVSVLLTFIRKLPGRIVRGLGNVGNLLYSAGRKVIQGLIDGLTSKLRALRDKVSSVASAIKNALPNSPAAKAGPLKGIHFQDIGAAIVNDLRRGLTDGQVGLATEMAGIASGLRVGPSRITAAPFGEVPNATGRGGPGQVVIHLANHGVIGSRQEVDNFLSTSIDRLRREGRLGAAIR